MKKSPHAPMATQLGLILAVLAPPCFAQQLPDPNRPWIGRDYQAVAVAIREQSLPLPRISDPSGATILMRLTNPDNLAVFTRSKITFQRKWQEYLKIQKPLQVLAEVYGKASNDNDPLSEENARLYAFRFHHSLLGITLLEEAIQLRTEKGGSRMEADLQRYQQLKDNLIQDFTSLSHALTNTELFADEEMNLILKAMDHTVPKATPRFSRSQKTTLMNTLVAYQDAVEGENSELLLGMIHDLERDQNGGLGF